MEYAYLYGDPERLYLNVTNRCTNRCAFCVRCRAEGLGGAVLRGDDEPDLGALEAAVRARGPLGNFREIVWCGYGEPTFRLDLILAAATWLRSGGATIRLNTNGHTCRIHGRDVLPELARAVDVVSISLNAPNCLRYLEVCRPIPDYFEPVAGGLPNPALAWDDMLDFLFRSPVYFEKVQASVVGSALRAEEIDSCRLLARSLGVRQFRVR